MTCDVVDDISDTSSLFVAVDGGIVLDLIVCQCNFDVEDRSESVLLVVGDGDLLSKVRHA